MQHRTALPVPLLPLILTMRIIRPILLWILELQLRTWELGKCCTVALGKKGGAGHKATRLHIRGWFINFALTSANKSTPVLGPGRREEQMMEEISTLSVPQRYGQVHVQVGHPPQIYASQRISK